MAQQRTVRVTGRGAIKVKPDMTRVTMAMTGCCPAYEQTLKRSGEDTEILKDILENQGFERTEIKTLSFDVNTKHESYKAKDGNWKQRLVGYEFRHVLKIEFDSDNTRLGKILYALANAKQIRPEFRLSYTVKDKEGSKNMLLGRAVEDARVKADVLTQAAGVSLKGIQSIDYSWVDIEFECRPMGDSMLMEECSAVEEDAGYSIDIEPDDIEASDTVTVVWEIA